MTILSVEIASCLCVWQPGDQVYLSDRQINVKLGVLTKNNDRIFKKWQFYH